ncbi:SpoIID/LytB domain-containing protein [Fervidobacterium gondwanense]|uniref:SpoIID/LytB domain-containing protein n=1 Tax=Fervidobacterium gondwanense TaxID=44754 RepID=UPI003C78AE9F
MKAFPDLLTVLFLTFLVSVFGQTFASNNFTINIEIRFPDNIFFDSSPDLENDFTAEIVIEAPNGMKMLFPSHSLINSFSVSNPGKYKIFVDVFYKGERYFTGNGEIYIGWDNTGSLVVVNVKPITSTLLITFKIDQKSDYLNGKVIYLENRTSREFKTLDQINEEEPIKLELLPGNYEIGLAKNDGTPTKLISYPIALNPGEFLAIMTKVDTKKNSITLERNVARLSKVISFDSEANRICFELEGDFKLSKDVKVVGYERSNWANVLYPGMKNLIAEFSGDRISRILSFENAFPKKVRVLVSARINSVGGMVSNRFNDLLIELNGIYDLYAGVDNNLVRLLSLVGNRKIMLYKNNNFVYIETESGIYGPFMDGTRFYLKSRNSDSYVLLVQRSRNKYYGDFEILATTQGGFYLINDVEIEQYLYSVVSSEMPSTYHLEVLKAQAVVARTYAIDKILSDRRYAKIGANIDDSINFQAYNTQKTSERAVSAVKLTSGELLLYNSKPASTFYYAVSGGVNFDAKDVFKMTVPYLRPKINGINMASIYFLEDEQSILNFLKNWDRQSLSEIGFVEAENGFFRWKVEFSPQELYERLSNLKVKSTPKENSWSVEDNNQVPIYRVLNLAKALDEKFGSSNHVIVENIGLKTEQAEILSLQEEQEINCSQYSKNNAPVQATDEGIIEENKKSGEKITDIYISKRTDGRYVEELTIEMTNSIYKLSEADVRKLFNVSGKKITLLNGIQRDDLSSFPSKFYSIDVIRDSELNINSVVIYGGGFGHGIGLSQVAANAFAKKYGWTYQQILEYFYGGTKLTKVY